MVISLKDQIESKRFLSTANSHYLTVKFFSIEGKENSLAP